jgi:hypothetical protein
MKNDVLTCRHNPIRFQSVLQDLGNFPVSFYIKPCHQICGPVHTFHSIVEISDPEHINHATWKSTRGIFFNTEK